MFITLERPEGSGKTSHIRPLTEWLSERGHKVFATREPGGTNIGEQVRDVIHDLKNTEMHPRTETLLYQAARAQIAKRYFRGCLGPTLSFGIPFLNRPCYINHAQPPKPSMKLDGCWRNLRTGARST